LKFSWKWLCDWEKIAFLNKKTMKTFSAEGILDFQCKKQLKHIDSVFFILYNKIS